jgi:hypothetical protein
LTENTTIPVSIETKAKIDRTKTLLETILRKKNVSYDKLFQIYFSVYPLEYQLQMLILEENPSIKFDKRCRKKKDANAEE